MDSGHFAAVSAILEPLAAPTPNPCRSSDRVPERGFVSESLQPPDYVVAAFGADAHAAQQLDSHSGRLWRYGDLVLRPAGDPVIATWSAGVFDELRIDAVRVPRPLRSLDGRWVVSGWCARRYLTGRPAARYDESLLVADALDHALADVSVPKMLSSREDLASWADAVAWDPDADTQGRLAGAGARWMELAAGRRPLDLPVQLVHGDLFGNILYAGSAPPAVVGFYPLVRPAGYAAAVIAVDALAWGGADRSVISNRLHGEGWGELLRRACLYRLAYVAAHPRATAAAVAGMIDACDQLEPIFTSL